MRQPGKSCLIAKKEEIVNFQEGLLRLVAGHPEYPFGRAAVAHVSTKSLHKPIKGLAVIASLLLIGLAAASTTATGQQPSANPQPTIVQQTNVQQTNQQQSNTAPQTPGQPAATPLP